jgi:hypothetical protein
MDGQWFFFFAPNPWGGRSIIAFDANKPRNHPEATYFLSNLKDSAQPFAQIYRTVRRPSKTCLRIPKTIDPQVSSHTASAVG